MERDWCEMTARELLASCLVWDSHCCAPLHPDYPLGNLKRHLDAGVTFVSINVGMDMNPVAQVMQVMASFRSQIEANADWMMLVAGVESVDRAKSDGKLAIAFDLEGAVPLMGRPEMVQLYYDLGVRQIHLAYNRNNEVACGCYDDDGPLTALGREVVHAVYKTGMLMDCSHSGHRTSLDIMEMGLGPVFFSHANPRSINGDLRNVSDQQIKACVQTGGVVCVNGVGRFLGDPAATTDALIEAIDATVEAAGIKHTGLALDYEYDDLGLAQLPANVDRGYWWPAEHGYGPSGVRGIRIAEPEQLVECVAGLIDRGYRRGDIEAIMGGNMRRLAARSWAS